MDFRTANMTEALDVGDDLGPGDTGAGVDEGDR